MTIKNIIISASVALAGLSTALPAYAGNDPFIGEIMTVGYTFCPRGWAEANGQLLPISTNTALFSLYGTTYGGDGRTTFGLPDLRGRVAVHLGQGPGLLNYNLGSTGGTETNTLTVNQMPNHGHRAGIKSVTEPANSPSPAGNTLTVQKGNAYNSGTAPGPVGSRPNFMHPESLYVEPTGGGQAVNNIQPFTTVRKCVALVGIFPSRS